MTESQRKPSTRPPDTAADVYHQRIVAAFDYPVHFTRGVFEADNPLLASVMDRLGERRRHRAAVYVDSGAAEAHAGLLERIREYFHARPKNLELAAPPQTVPGGEAAKNGWEIVREVMTTIGNLHLDRQSFIVAVGGGAALDMVGFATSLVHRGLRLVRVPTTVLAQNDAGVGVKTSMDEHGQKNFVGTFAPPFAVINDFSFLHTLADRDWIGGAAEAFKVAIIKDADFFEFLCAAAERLADRDQQAMETLIRRCAILHLEHIRTGGDPFELGSARPLDFGHWAGHKIETLSGYSVGHGQAVAIGIALDCHYAMQEKLLTAEQLERILSALERCGLPTWHDCLRRRNSAGELAILEGLSEFREHLGGALTITLPDGIGRSIDVHRVSADKVERAVAFLRRRRAEGLHRR